MMSVQCQSASKLVLEKMEGGEEREGRMVEGGKPEGREGGKRREGRGKEGGGIEESSQ